MMELQGIDLSATRPYSYASNLTFIGVIVEPFKEEQCSGFTLFPYLQQGLWLLIPTWIQP
jgi:hypothetical protein